MITYLDQCPACGAGEWTSFDIPPEKEDYIFTIDIGDQGDFFHTPIKRRHIRHTQPIYTYKGYICKNCQYYYIEGD